MEKNECLAPATASEQYATALEQHSTQILKQEHVVTKKVDALEQTNT